MKSILFAAAAVAMSAGAAMAGEGRGGPFDQHLSGFLGTYVVGPVAQLAPRPPAPAPAAAQPRDVRIVLMPALAARIARTG